MPELTEHTWSCPSADSGPEGSSLPHKSLLGIPWSDEGAGYVGLFMTGHLVSVKTCYWSLCMWAKFPLNFSEKDTNRGKQLPKSGIWTNQLACVFPTFHIYMCVCVFVSKITAHIMSPLPVRYVLFYGKPRHCRSEIFALDWWQPPPGPWAVVPWAPWYVPCRCSPCQAGFWWADPAISCWGTRSLQLLVHWTLCLHFTESQNV